MKYSVIATIYNRPQLTVINTINALGQNDLRDVEILFVDDGSTHPYEPLFEQYEDLNVRYIRVDTLEDRRDTYNMDGYNNPAYAWNCALKEARGDHIIGMSSDCMPQAWALATIKRISSLEKLVWHPCVYDMGTSRRSGMAGRELCGPTRISPFGWMFATHRKNIEGIDGWDEGYLKGIGFEDNDFMARLMLHVGRFVIDKSVSVWHQSHPDVFCDDDKKGWNINREYTEKKWGGIPWHRKLGCPLKSMQTTVNDQIVVDVTLKEPAVKA